MGKKRPQGHVLESESKAALLSSLSEWIVNETKDDYGIDFIARPVEFNDEEGIILPNQISIQLKATESFNSDNRVTYQLDVDNLEDYMDLRTPVVLTLYEQESKEIYWTIIQTYIWNEYPKPREEWKQQTTVQISTDRTPLSGNLLDLIDTVEEAEKKIMEYHLENTFADMLSQFASRSDIEQAIREGESKTVEFKRTFPSHKILNRTITGMANANGGAIVIGVDNSGKPVGVKNDKKLQERVERTAQHEITPEVDVDVSVESFEGKQLVVVRIPQFSEFPHSVDGVFYRRFGVTNRKMDAYDLKELLT